MLRNPEKAIPAYAKTISLAPDHPEAYPAYMSIMMRCGSIPEIEDIIIEKNYRSSDADTRERTAIELKEEAKTMEETAKELKRAAKEKRKMAKKKAKEKAKEN
jgi:hypothetical protein